MYIDYNDAGKPRLASAGSDMSVNAVGNKITVMASMLYKWRSA